MYSLSKSFIISIFVFIVSNGYIPYAQAAHKKLYITSNLPMSFGQSNLRLFNANELLVGICSEVPFGIAPRGYEWSIQVPVQMNTDRTIGLARINMPDRGICFAKPANLEVPITIQTPIDLPIELMFNMKLSAFTGCSPDELAPAWNKAVTCSLSGEDGGGCQIDLGKIRAGNASNRILISFYTCDLRRAIDKEKRFHLEFIE
jgi:hypothetical protein